VGRKLCRVRLGEDNNGLALLYVQAVPLVSRSGTGCRPEGTSAGRRRGPALIIAVVLQICFSRSRVMHDLLIGLYVNRVEFGRPV
jgi:hypothetical protein